MTITRHEQSEIYSKVVEANGFVFTAGIVPSVLTADVKGQTEEVLAEIDRLLALCGTKSRTSSQATIWLADIRHREAMNEAWKAWTGGKDLLSAPASRPSSPTPACWSRSASSPPSRRSLIWSVSD